MIKARLSIGLVTLAALLLFSAAGSAQDFEKGSQAYEQGDYAEAIREWELLGERGDAEAQLALGDMHLKGRGVPQDYAEATRWYRLAAEQGDPEGQFSLGAMYDIGLGVPLDHAEAARWYRLAAEQGHGEAQFDLGLLYHQGHGIAQNYPEAVRWYRLAADQGHAEAQFNLGILYTPQALDNLVLAHKWLELAAAQGNVTAASVREIVASRMTPAQIAEAEELAREWLAERE